MEQERKVYSVSELTAQIRGTLENGFPSLWLRGEISEYAPRDSGVYLTLKDEQAQIRVVYFRGAAICRSLGLGIGSEVEVFGMVTVYDRQGAYQLRAMRIQPVGQGNLYQQYLELRNRLGTEGLFDPSRKRAIPRFPKIIGVVTSPDGAAIRDFLKTLSLAGVHPHVRIFPTLVQGKEAAAKIAAAIQYANYYRLCDVLVVTRGGGSMEDLWPFNEEPVARAIYASEIPVISAVGHERDFSISDDVADLRCATPTAAASYLAAEPGRVAEFLQQASRRMEYSLRMRWMEAQRRLERCRMSPLLAEPLRMLEHRQQRLDDLKQRLGVTLPQVAAEAQHRWQQLETRLRLASQTCLPLRQSGLRELQGRLLRAGKNMIPDKKAVLQRVTGMLQMLGPSNVLQRGYSILRKRDGRIVRRPADVAPGECLAACLAEGKLDVVAKTVEMDKA